MAHCDCIGGWCRRWLLSGIHSFILSSSSVLKGVGSPTARRSVNLRFLLVVFQFGFAVTMIVSAIVVRQQIEFVQNRQAGYNRDNLLHIPMTGDLRRNFNSFKAELMGHTSIESVTRTSAPLTEQWSSTTGIRWNGKSPEERTDIERIFCDENISKTGGLTIIEGRDLDLAKYPSDTSAALINETVLALMGFKNPIGEKITDDGRVYEIVGVVKDFVLTSPFQKSEPVILFGGKSDWAFNTIYVKFGQNAAIGEGMKLLSNLSAKYNPDYPFDYHFADVEYQRKFDDLTSTLVLTTIFTALAIFIACLGLFGLAIYMTESRMKEIGIRKIMGSSTFGITRLLSVSSLKPVIISVAVFTPIAWLAMNWWLENFAYRTALDVWIFFAAAVGIILISSLTIAVQTVSAARVNPTSTLKAE